MIGGLALRAAAAVPGAFEGFPTQDNADSWTVYDFADETAYFPVWQNVADPYVEFVHEGNQGLWFFSGDGAGSPDWLGDYAAAGIESITTDVFVDSRADLDQIDCVVRSDGPVGSRLYFSESFLDTDFPGDGWWELTFLLESIWYYIDGQGNFAEVAMEAEDFGAVEEIGFRFFPKTGTVANRVAAIDNVSLDPRVRSPELAISRGSGDFVIAFTPPETNVATIETWNPGGSPAWEAVPGQTDLVGPGVHVFTTPLNGGREFFRVRTEPRFTQVVID